MEIIGEALNRLCKVDSETAQRMPDISRIIGLRNFLAHGYAVVILADGYAVVDDTNVWSAVSEGCLRS